MSSSCATSPLHRLFSYSMLYTQTAPQSEYCSLQITICGFYDSSFVPVYNLCNTVTMYWLKLLGFDAVTALEKIKATNEFSKTSAPKDADACDDATHSDNLTEPRLRRKKPRISWCSWIPSQYSDSKWFFYCNTTIILPVVPYIILVRYHVTTL